MIEHLEQIQSLLKSSPFVHDQSISVEDRKEAWFFRGDIYFIDNSRLHFRELFVGEKEPFKLAYTYHYQRADETMIFRYDNTRHFPRLPTAPHHKHVTDTEVVATPPPEFETVLREIESLISIK